ncbi:LacI family DNA-binding transcriptional regulator [Acidobacterium sp. S8]|uniref:LacI family DNA-binding transcriptional regulator n=1 Tax=Acidobacterium sp. S8 TaxID=1641854 RepID=UPI0020B14EAF|nr:LacI family DNA-binding transcriptional regulator [Acidobacterium sp. S8]
MKDIANDLGLSVVTISKVLRNHPDVGEETRERVLRRVKELNYQPNILARSLVTGRSYLVGLVVPDLLHPFFAEVAKALSTAIQSKGYSLIVSSSEEDPELEQREIRQLQARRLDAMVIASTRTGIADFDQLQKEEVFVLIDRDLPGLAANYIGIDDEAAGRIATKHLIDIGCRRIAHIRGRENSTGVRRFDGYRKTLIANGLEYRDEYVIARSRVDTQSLEQGAEAMRLLLHRNPRPDGVFCYNDPLAIGAIRSIMDAGLRIPEDIALIGCGNLHYDDCLRVPLSSIDQHSQQIGQRAAELVLSLIEAKQRPLPRSYILNPELVVRASTRRL